MRFELVRVALCALVLVILMAPVPSSGPGVAYAQGITRDYAENGTGPVISFSASDDEGTVLAWSLTGVDGGDFSIDGGKLNFRRPPDFEVPADADRDNVYMVSVNVTDGVNTTSSNVAVTVTNVDEEGIVYLSSIQPEVDIPLSATLSDPDGEITNLAWSWESSPDGTTEWTTTSGAESDANVPVDGDIGRYLRITAPYADGEGTGKSAQAISHHVVRETHPPGHAPEFPDSETGERSVAENTEPGTDIGVPIAADDEENHVLTYTLSGTDAASFDIERASGQLLTKAPLGHETKNSYSLTVTVSDPTNAYDDIAATVTVTNVEEEGTLTLSTPQPHVDEELQAYLDDPDEGVSDATWVWEKSQDRLIWTVIDGAESNKYTPVDDDIENYLRITASYTDREGSGKRAQVVSFNAVHELEVNHVPTFPSTETGLRSVPENTPPGTEIGEPFMAIDDHAHTLTYSLEGAAADSFDIDVSTGHLRTRAPLDYETKNLYSVTVMVHDGEDVHGNPDHSNDASLVAAIVVTDVDCDCVTGDAVADADDNPGLGSDCEALLESLDKLAGSASLNWSEDTPITEWDGATVRGTPQRVVTLNLRDMGLDGAMPPELNLLAGLERLYLHGNKLTGGIPDLSSLTNLERLWLSDNNLTG